MDGEQRPGDLPINVRVQAMRTRNLWFLFAIHGLWTIGLAVCLSHFVPYATDLGIKTTTAAAMLGSVGAMSILGRLSLGVLTEQWGVRRSIVIILSSQAVSMLLPIIGSSPWILWIFVLAFGFGSKDSFDFSPGHGGVLRHPVHGFTLRHIAPGFDHRRFRGAVAGGFGFRSHRIVQVCLYFLCYLHGYGHCPCGGGQKDSLNDRRCHSLHQVPNLIQLLNRGQPE